MPAINGKCKRLRKKASMESNPNGSRANSGSDDFDDEILIPNYVCCVVTEGVWVWFAAVVLFAVLMFIATLKVSKHASRTSTRQLNTLPKLVAPFLTSVLSKAAVETKVFREESKLASSSSSRG